MTNDQVSPKKFDLEERTLDFAKRVVRMCKELPFNTVNDKLINQIIRSAGSVGANYREANDALGAKDFLMRLKISRKEAKETHFWLELIIEANPTLKKRIEGLFQESLELKKILSAIIMKLQKK
ncbi:MAG: four helix bundle protein [bacterium]|nr:four helix bundle protein [bacterium]